MEQVLTSDGAAGSASFAEADLAPDTASPEAPQPAAAQKAASRGLLIVAALLIAVPTAVGLFVLRSRAAPVDSGGFETAFDAANFGAANNDGPTSADLLQPGAGAADSARIRYIADGEPGDLANGGSIAVAEGMHLQVWVSPFPPTEFTTDVGLILTTESGEPVSDAIIETEWDMVMSHGPYFSTFRHIGEGRYEAASFDFFMFGPWQLDITVDSPVGNAAAKLAIFVWPE